MITARASGLLACTICGRVHRAQTARCTRCGAALISRDRASLQRVWAWLAAGMIAYVPANLYPMLITTTMGTSAENTIVGGAIELMNQGSYGIAAIVFGASVLIPMGKFVAIIFLALSVGGGQDDRSHSRLRLFHLVEFVGRWSMIDVFVVAILSALVHLGSVVSVNPGIAAVSFALSVAFTMLAAQSLDPRLIWDEEGDTRP